ncbi:MAG: hypothetical protein H6577_00015 [Lewinellaceae bacterium]|nr:hypothetical protein [Saprospiraceae bacterium]MCB9336495.1 hypothetical protein [Lewinellaceae bacterium]
MEGRLVQARTEGTPQSLPRILGGGPLSPLLSNILLNELDKELEKRGHRFVCSRGFGTSYAKKLRRSEWAGAQ